MCSTAKKGNKGKGKEAEGGQAEEIEGILGYNGKTISQETWEIQVKLSPWIPSNGGGGFGRGGDGGRGRPMFPQNIEAMPGTIVWLAPDYGNAEPLEGEVENAGADFINVKITCPASQKLQIERRLSGRQRVDIGPSCVNFKRMTKALETFASVEYFKDRLRFF